MSSGRMSLMSKADAMRHVDQRRALDEWSAERGHDFSDPAHVYYGKGLYPGPADEVPWKFTCTTCDVTLPGVFDWFPTPMQARHYAMHEQDSQFDGACWPDPRHLFHLVWP